MKKAKGYFSVVPPSYRSDVQRDADIVEEVARAYGYKRIPATLPKAVIGIKSQGEDSQRRLFSQTLLKEMKESFLKSGFTEVINYSFMGGQDLRTAGYRAEDERRKMVMIRNPLSSEGPCMRTTLVPALIRNIVHNVSQGNRTLRLFELSRVFFSAHAGLPEERNYFAAARVQRKNAVALPR